MSYSKHCLFLVTPLCILLLACIGESAVSQEWHTRIANSSSAIGQITTISADDEYVYFAGSVINSSGNQDVLLGCLHSSGDTVWTTTWDQGGDETVAQFILDHDNGLLLALTQIKEGDALAYVARWSRQGALHWHRSFSDGVNRTSAAGLTLLNSGSVVFTFGSEGAEGTRSGVASLSAKGTEQWLEYIPDETPVAIDSDGSRIAVAAVTTATPTESTFRLFTAEGKLIESDTYSGAGNGRVLPVCVQKGLKGFYVGGNILFADGAGSPFVLQYSTSGDRQWVVLPIKTIGQHRFVDLEPYPGGGVVVTARMISETDIDIYLARLDADGTGIWARSFNRPGSGRDETPPLFTGVGGGQQDAHSLTLFWHPASDDICTRDEIRYNIYTSTSPGKQNFSQPMRFVQGECSAKLADIPAGVNQYVVVRAVDAFGNEDSNVHEIAVLTAAATRTQADQQWR